jgi:four helix bundle protein
LKTNNVIREKSFAFAIRIIKAYQHLSIKKKEFVLSKQLLKSGTSIGANIEESIGGQSETDFLHKVTISYKEAREAIYWIKLLQATDYLTKKEAESLLADANEICRILAKIQLTIKRKREKN